MPQEMKILCLATNGKHILCHQAGPFPIGPGNPTCPLLTDGRAGERKTITSTLAGISPALHGNSMCHDYYDRLINAEKQADHYAFSLSAQECA